MDNDSERERQYFAHMVDSETTRIRNLMQPFLGHQNRENTELFEQLARILGELGARANVIQQAAELQLLAENPLQIGPLLYGDLELTVLSLDSAGFHSTETLSNGTVLRWTNSSELTMSLPAYRPCPKVLRIYFHEIIKSEYRKSLKIYVDGKEISHRVRKIDNEICLECILPPAVDLTMTKITLKLPAVHAPCDLGPSGDRRKLGIAITRITVGNSNSFFIDRLLRYLS